MKASDILFKRYGGKRAEEILTTFNKWYKGLYQHKAGVPIASKYQVEGYDFNKSATTTSEGNAGFLVPGQISGDICLVLHEYGRILSKLTEVVIPPGSNLQVNELTTLPVATINRTQCDPIPEVTLELLGSPQKLKPAFVGGLFVVSNELLNNPGANFSTMYFNLMADIVVGAQEKVLLQEATKGLFNDASVNVEADVDTTDPQSVARFVYKAIVNNAALANAEHALIIAPPHVVPQLASGGSNPLMRCGPGGSVGFLCYDMVPHADSSNGPWNIAMVDTRNIHYATDGALTMDINPHVNGNANCSVIKGGQYFDYVLCHADKMSRAEVVIANP